jgi:hypothetical protein
MEIFGIQLLISFQCQTHSCLSENLTCEIVVRVHELRQFQCISYTEAHDAEILTLDFTKNNGITVFISYDAQSFTLH